MDFIVCIKQVPDTTEVRIDPVKGTLVREGVPSIVNPFDKNALEAALQLREIYGGHITVVTMGPQQANVALRECLAMGADEAILLSDRAFAGADTWATSYTLAQAIKKIGQADIIFCGKQAIDGDTAQVGPGIAEHLGLPQVTYVQKIVDIQKDHVVVERAIEGGYEVICIPLPAMIAVEKSINVPRYPTVLGTVKAYSNDLTVWSAEDIDASTEKTGLNGSPTQVKRVFAPSPKGKCKILESNTLEELCDLVVATLQQVKIV